MNAQKVSRERNFLEWIETFFCCAMAFNVPLFRLPWRKTENSSTRNHYERFPRFFFPFFAAQITWWWDINISGHVLSGEIFSIFSEGKKEIKENESFLKSLSLAYLEPPPPHKEYDVIREVSQQNSGLELLLCFYYYKYKQTNLLSRWTYFRCEWMCLWFVSSSAFLFFFPPRERMMFNLH